jgi:DNA-binding NarL/FixJ family response regulator
MLYVSAKPRNMQKLAPEVKPIVVRIEQFLVKTSSKTALNIAKFINEHASTDETIVLDEEILPTDYSQTGLLRDIIREIRINPYLGGEKNKIRKSKIIIRAFVNLSNIEHIDHEHLLFSSPHVKFWDISEDTSKPNLEDQPMSAEAFARIKHFIPIGTGDDMADNRHNQANLWSIFQIYRLLRGLTTYHSSLFPSNAIPPIWPSDHWTSNMRIRLFHHRYDLTEQRIDPNGNVFPPDHPKGKKLNKKIDAKKLHVLITNIQSLLSTGTNSLKIALIDDDASIQLEGCQTDFGWTSALNQLLLEPLVVDVLKETGVDFNHGLVNKQAHNFEAIVHHIHRIQPACILLDIRLHKKENGEQDNAEPLSGENLLNRLRIVFPTLPIIVFASTSLPRQKRKYLQLGADAVWIKEGIDQDMSILRHFQNIMRLLELINKVCDKTYQFMSKLGQMVIEIEQACKQDKPIYWWQKYERPQWGHLQGGKYKKFAFSNSSRYDIQDQLPKLLRNLLMSLCGEVKKSLSYDESIVTFGQNSAELVNSLVIQMAKIIELIHGFDPKSKAADRIDSSVIGGRKGKDGSIEVLRGDWIAHYIYKLRNQGAHLATAGLQFEFGDPSHTRSIGCVIAHFMAYLMNFQQPYTSNLSVDHSCPHTSISNPFEINYLNTLINRNNKKSNIKKHQKIFNRLFVS